MMTTTKFSNYRSATTWHRVLASLIDTLIFSGIAAASIYIMKIGYSCSGMFCGVGLLIGAILGGVITAVTLNCYFKRTLGDVCLGILYLDKDRKKTGRGEALCLQIVKYLYLGLFCFLIFGDELPRGFAEMLYKRPLYVTTQEVVDQEMIRYGYSNLRDTKIVSKSEYDKELRSYEQKIREHSLRIQYISYGLNVLFCLLFGYIYFAPYKKTGTTRFLYRMDMYPVRKLKEDKI